MSANDTDIVVFAFAVVIVVIFIIRALFNLIIPPRKTTIFVNGASTQRVKPDLCDISFRVTHEAAGSDEAVTKVTQVANQLSSLLKGFTASKPERTIGRAPQALDAEAPVVAGFPVTKWTMQHLQKGTRTVRVDDSTTQSQGGANQAHSFTTTYREETRTYATASFSATFHDFDALEKFVGSLMHESLVEVDNLHWSVTAKTRSAFAATVRAGAVYDALVKACNYAAEIRRSDAGAGTGKVHVVELNDHSHDGGAPVLFRTKAAAPMRESAEHETLSFKPEPVEVSVNVALKCVL